MSFTRSRTWFRTCFLFALILTPSVLSFAYTNVRIAVYFRYQEVHSIPASLESFAAQWAKVEKQVKVEKVYLETTRNAQLATDAEVTALKEFFAGRGIQTSGALGLTANEPNGFQSYCYSTPADREKVKSMTEFTARHFDEIILDDFFFSNCKCDRCIAAKGARSWTQFRTEQMDEVSRDLIIRAAKAVNPKARIIIKYPNWYESFQGLGYDLAVQPKLFDAIYTGTETRDGNSGQRLQPYQSFLQTQYFNNDSLWREFRHIVGVHDSMGVSRFPTRNDILVCRATLQRRYTKLLPLLGRQCTSETSDRSTSEGSVRLQSR